MQQTSPQTSSTRWPHGGCPISCSTAPLPLGAPECRPVTCGHCSPQGWRLAGGGQGAARPWSSEPHCQPQPPPSVLERGHPWGGGNQHRHFPIGMSSSYSWPGQMQPSRLRTSMPGGWVAKADDMWRPPPDLRRAGPSRSSSRGDRQCLFVSALLLLWAQTLLSLRDAVPPGK